MQLGREGQKTEFTLVCRDASGEQMGKGGDAVLISIVHKETKDWWVGLFTHLHRTPLGQLRLPIKSTFSLQF